MVPLRDDPAAAPDGVVLHAVDVTRLVTAGHRAVDAEKRIAALLAGTRRLQEITASVSASSSAAEIARAVIHHAVEELSASAGLLVRGEGNPQLEHAIGFPPELVEQWRAFPATLPRALRGPDAGKEAAEPTVPGGTLTASASPRSRCSTRSPCTSRPATL